MSAPSTNKERGNKRKVNSPDNDYRPAKKETMEIQIQRLTESVNQCTSAIVKNNERFANIESKLDTVNDGLSVLKIEIISIKESFSKEIDDLKATDDELKIQMNEIQQGNLACAFNVIGIPLTDNKDPITNMNLILKPLGESVVSTDFKYVRLLPNFDNTRCRITGCFWAEMKKNSIMIKFKESTKAQKPIYVNDIYTVDINSPFNGKQILFKNQLTKYNVTLLKQARTHQGVQFKYVWEGNGRIFARRDENSRPLIIKSLKQLDNTIKAMMNH
jgi:hypothetical protein